MQFNENNIPKNLKEAVQIMKDDLTVEQYDIIIELSFEKFFININPIGGDAMRRMWGLWNGHVKNNKNEIVKWFTDRGIIFAHDMSKIIYKAFWCEITCNKFNLEKEINDCRNYWISKGYDPDTLVYKKDGGNVITYNYQYKEKK